LLSGEIYGEGTVNSVIKTPEIGLLVKKVGRTTGLTIGRIISLNTTVLVSYSHGLARFVGQIITSHMSDPGDSGSLVVNYSDNKPVGLLFAGSDIVTVLNPIADVISGLNIRFGDRISKSTTYEAAVLAEYRSGNIYRYCLEPITGINGFVRTAPDCFRMYKNAGSNFTAQYLWYHSKRNDFTIGPINSGTSLPQYQNTGLIGYVANNKLLDQGVDTVLLKELFNPTTSKHRMCLSNQNFVDGQDGFYFTRALGYVRTIDAALASNYPEITIAEFTRSGTYYYAPNPVQKIDTFIRLTPDRFTLYTQLGDGFAPVHLWYNGTVKNYAVSPPTAGALLPQYQDLGLLGFVAVNNTMDSIGTEELILVFNIAAKRHKLMFRSDFRQGVGGFYFALSLGYVRRVA
jgi:hypothetical protein